MTDKKDIMSFWPMPNFKPRKSQVEALEWIQSLPEHIKYILVEIPVGGGKSPLALNVSGWLSGLNGNGFIITTQKILQKQYEDSFDSQLLKAVYGKANYTCSSKNTTCDIGSDIKPQCDNCPHRNAIGKAIKSPNMLLNYTLALLFFMQHDKLGLKKRDVIVFDECHTLENHLTEFGSVNITMKKCIDLDIVFKPCTSMNEAFNWINETYYSAVYDYVEKLHNQYQEISDKVYLNNAVLTRDDKKIIMSYLKWQKHFDSLQVLLTTNKKEIFENYVLVNDKVSFKFKQLYGSNAFHQIVKPMANKFMFMSSTILNKDAFCKDLGINPDEAEIISIDSEFDCDNRPVIYKPVAKMNYGWNTDERKKDRQSMIEAIMNICEEHNDENGIIHTGSFQISDWLVKDLRNMIPHRILHHGTDSGKSRDEVINEYINESDTPTILLSPSITEGLDLVDDKGRFAIFAKVPYPYMGDQWVKKRMTLSNEWYQRQAMIAIIQGGGRVVRSKEDWGVTYILDSSFGFLYSKMHNKIPKWWKQAYFKF
jgi:Rad3-related DNA helicase